MTKVMNNSVALIVGLLLTSVFLSPSNFLMVCAIASIVVVSALAYVYSTGWIVSKPNEWLLIIENGQMKKAGVGLKTFKWWNQTAVTFPSTIQGVTFKAMQVTKENFGIEIEGIVFWAVHRFADGPFKCYKYTEGSDANENVRQVTESIVRSQISNTTLLNVLRKRVDLREEVTKQLRQQLQGWGIWPETVEITEVRICSSQTFKDMQTEFRFTHKQKAEKARQETKAVLEEEKTKLQLQLQQIQRDISTELKEFQQTQAILRETYQNKFEKEKFLIQKQQLEQNQEIDLLKEDLYQSKQILCKQNVLELKEMEFEHKSKEEQKWRDLYNTMNERNLQIEKLQNIQEMYDNMHSLQSVTINKFQGPDSFNHISSAMPAVNLLNQALKP